MGGGGEDIQSPISYVSVKLLVPIKLLVVLLTCKLLYYPGHFVNIKNDRSEYRHSQKHTGRCLFIIMDCLCLQRVGYVCGRITVNNSFLGDAQKCSKIEQQTVSSVVPLAIPVEYQSEKDIE